MGCATGIIRYLVFIFNLIFAIAGLVLLVVGVLYQISLNDATKALDNTSVTAAPILLIVVGAIIFVISFFGCCGAIKESTCMLTTYAVIILGIFIIQIAIGVFAFLVVKDNGGDFRKEISNALEKAYNNYNRDSQVKESIDLMQQVVKCCGLNGPTSWGSSDLPESCCENNKRPCYLSDNTLFNDGCNSKVYKTLKSSGEILGYIALGLCVTELIAAIFSLCLSSSIRNERRRGGYA